MTTYKVFDDRNGKVLYEGTDKMHALMEINHLINSGDEEAIRHTWLEENE